MGDDHVAEPPRPSRVTPIGRAWALAAGIAALAAGVWFLAAAHMSIPDGPMNVPWPVLAVVFTAAEAFCLEFEYRGGSHAVTLTQVPLAIGLVYVSPLGLLAARAIGTAVGIKAIRRLAGVKLFFNLAVSLLETCLAVVVFEGIRAGASPVGPRGWIAIFAALIAIDIVSQTAVVAVVWLTTGELQRRSLPLVVAVIGMLIVINGSVSIIAVNLLWTDTRLMLFLAGVCLLLSRGYLGYVQLRKRYADLHTLYEFTSKVATVVETDQVITSILAEARELLRAEFAGLAFVVNGRVLRHSLDGDHLATDFVAAPNGLEQLVLADQPALIPKSGGDPVLRALADDAGWRDAMAVPMITDDGAGMLVVANRTDDITTFDDGDLRLFSALTNHAMVAIRGGHLLDRLRHEAAAKEHQALHDALTGLANRTLFADRVTTALNERRPEQTVAVMVMDLDEFKEVNDTLGHHTGDALLRETAVRIVRAVEHRGTVARLGGDEFAVVIPDAEDGEAATDIARAIREAVERPVIVDELVLEVGVSLGVALAPTHGEDAATLLQRADVAMYAAKSGRTGVEVYAAERDHYSPRRLALVSELRHAIESDELAVYFQPQAELPSGHVEVVEALLRWNHPTHGFVPPDEFIPVAEHSGLIRPLTLWVLQASLRQVATWRKQGLDLSVAVNLSARSLLDTSLVQDVEHLVQLAQVPPEALILELTESSVMFDPGRSMQVLDQLASVGLRIAIDDFGTGYSSLSRLKRLPVSEMKIDRSFVMDMITDEDDHAIVRSTIDLARNLGLRVVAEGVEDRPTWDRLINLGCDAAQGYYLSKPVPAGHLTTWLLEQRRALTTSAGAGSAVS